MQTRPLQYLVQNQFVELIPRHCLESTQQSLESYYNPVVCQENINTGNIAQSSPHFTLLQRCWRVSSDATKVHRGGSGGLQGTASQLCEPHMQQLQNVQQQKIFEPAPSSCVTAIGDLQGFVQPVQRGERGGGSGYSGIISRLYSDYQLSQSALQHMYCLARSCLKSGLVCCAEPCLLYNIIYNAVDKQSSDNGGLDSVGHLQAVLQFDCQFFSQLGKECGLQ